MKKRIIKIPFGHVLFLEGDPSQDLYILVKGRLNVVKGDSQIGQIVEPGAIFGEMSALLGQKRTASIKAAVDSQVICIPKEDVPQFCEKFPEVVHETNRILAQRLDEASQALQGLKEFADQLPDAVVISDVNSKIITINEAAVKLYGRTWGSLRLTLVQNLYREVGDFKAFVDQVKLTGKANQRVFAFEHPEKGLRYVSLSANVLRNARGQFQGVLSLGRDVTKVRQRESRLRRFLFWLTPLFIALALAVGSWIYYAPHLGPALPITDLRQKQLRNQLAKDYFLLRSLLLPYFEDQGKVGANNLFEDFFAVQEKDLGLYNGIVLLDQDKKVFDAFNAETGKTIPKMKGTTYGHLTFKGSRNSLHKVLTLYRRDKEHPQGYKGLEMAFEVKKEGEIIGWLVFQMKEQILLKEFGMTAEKLTGFRFKDK